MPRRVAVLVLIPLLTLLTAGTARAETRLVRDSYNGSIPALNVKYGVFAYTQKSATFRVKVEQLSKEKTMLVAKYYRRDGVTVQVATKWVHGNQRVFVERYDNSSQEKLTARSVTVRWDFAKDIVIIKIPQQLLAGNVAGFYAWSQYKNALEGAAGGRDDLYVGSLHRD